MIKSIKLVGDRCAKALLGDLLTNGSEEAGSDSGLDPRAQGPERRGIGEIFNARLHPLQGLQHGGLLGIEEVLELCEESRGLSLCSLGVDDVEPEELGKAFRQIRYCWRGQLVGELDLEGVEIGSERGTDFQRMPALVGQGLQIVGYLDPGNACHRSELAHELAALSARLSLEAGVQAADACGQAEG